LLLPLPLLPLLLLPLLFSAQIKEARDDDGDGDAGAMHDDDGDDDESANFWSLFSKCLPSHAQGALPDLG
jgi:hypothetical protein